MSTPFSRAQASEPPYARIAFLNPYNLTLWGGALLFGVLGGHNHLLVLACAAEAMWMIFAPDSKLLRAAWFDKVAAADAEVRAHRRCDARAKELSPFDRARFAALVEQKVRITQLAQDSPSLGAVLLGSELSKLDRLIEDFVDTAIAAARAEQHAAASDPAVLRRLQQTYQAQRDLLPKGDPHRELAERNIDVVARRRQRHEDLIRGLYLARGRMDLIEHTFLLLADEIVTMASPSELVGRIEELRVAVDAIRESAGMPDDVSGAPREEGGAEAAPSRRSARR